MSPLYHSGDFLVLKKVALPRLKAGSRIVFHHPVYGLMVKTVSGVSESGLAVQGENEASLSPEQMGPVPMEWVLGKVIFHIAKNRL